MGRGESRRGDVRRGRVLAGGVAARRGLVLSAALLQVGVSVFGPRVSGVAKTRATGGGTPFSVPSELLVCGEALGAFRLGPRCPGHPASVYQSTPGAGSASVVIFG